MAQYTFKEWIEKQSDMQDFKVSDLIKEKVYTKDNPITISTKAPCHESIGKWGAEESFLIMGPIIMGKSLVAWIEEITKQKKEIYNLKKTIAELRREMNFKIDSLNELKKDRGED